MLCMVAAFGDGSYSLLILQIMFVVKPQRWTRQCFKELQTLLIIESDLQLLLVVCPQMFLQVSYLVIASFFHYGTLSLQGLSVEQQDVTV